MQAYDALSSVLGETFKSVSNAAGEVGKDTSPARLAPNVGASMFGSASSSAPKGSIEGKAALLRDISGRHTNEESVKQRDKQLLGGIAQARA